MCKEQETQATDSEAFSARPITYRDRLNNERQTLIRRINKIDQLLKLMDTIPNAEELVELIRAKY